jgi:transcriptional regulator with XRE-family HTH domain
MITFAWFDAREFRTGFGMQAVQCKMARAALGLGVRELAELASVSPDTVVRLEAGDRLRPRTVAAIQAALEAAGVEFIEENGGGPGVRLKKSEGPS